MEINEKEEQLAIVDEQPKKKVKKKKVKKKKKEKEVITFDEGKVIIVFVNRGFSEDVLASASKAGATGATVINGRGLGRIPDKFLGMTVMPGREIVMILVNAEICESVMTTIAEKNGVRTPAGGVCFAMPVSHMTKLKN